MLSDRGQVDPGVIVAEQDGAKRGMVVEITPPVRVPHVLAVGPYKSIRTPDRTCRRVDAAGHNLGGPGPQLRSERAGNHDVLPRSAHNMVPFLAVSSHLLDLLLYVKLCTTSNVPISVMPVKGRGEVGVSGLLTCKTPSLAELTG